MTSRITHSASRASNMGKASSCRRVGNKLPSMGEIISILREIWPSKTDQHYAHEVGISERMARYQLSNRYGISAPALVALLRSEHGLRILEEIMGDEKPRWWRRFRQQVDLSNTRAVLAQHQKKLQALEEAFSAD